MTDELFVPASAMRSLRCPECSKSKARQEIHVKEDKLLHDIANLVIDNINSIGSPLRARITLLFKEFASLEDSVLEQEELMFEMDRSAQRLTEIVEELSGSETNTD